MSAVLNTNPHRITPTRMRYTVTGVLLAHMLALWVVSSELAELPASNDSGQVLMADVVTDLPNPNPVPQAKPQTQITPLPAPVKQTRKTEEAAPQTTANTAAQVTSASTSNNAPVTGSAKAGSPSVVEPSADADYLKNPPPAYPRASRRLGEQGTVIVRVFISTQGLPEKAEVRTSSGFARLDQAALEAVQRWRFVPGRRSGTPEAMWFNIPVRFVLE